MEKQPVVVSQRGRQFATSAIALQGIILNEAEELLLLSSARRGDHGWQTVSGGLEAGETILEDAARGAGRGGEIAIRPLAVLHSHTFHYDENVPFMVGIYYLLRYEGGAVIPGDDMIGSDFKWWGLAELETAVAQQEAQLHFSTHLWMLRRAVKLSRVLADDCLETAVLQPPL